MERVAQRGIMAPMNAPNDEVAARAVLQQWCAAFEAADASAIAALYCTDAVMFGTTTQQALVGRAAVQAYFAAAFAALGLRRLELSQVTMQAWSQDTWVVGALDALHPLPSGPALRGRLSLVLRREASGWQIAHFHRSALPG